MVGGRWWIGAAACLLALGCVLVDRPASAQADCASAGGNPIVRFQTTLGDVDVELYCDDPTVVTTVDNFLQYVADGAYTDSGIIHRSLAMPPSTIAVIQGGGAYFDAGGVMRTVPTLDPIVLEAGLSNLRGTIAMARTNDPNSATSQWFINVADNSSALDPTGPNTGFAVFGTVTAGLGVVDSINAQTIWALNGGFLSEVPLVDYPDDGSSVLPYFVYVTDVSVVAVPEPTAAVQGLCVVGVVAALARRRRIASR